MIREENTEKKKFVSYFRVQYSVGVFRVRQDFWLPTQESGDSPSLGVCRARGAKNSSLRDSPLRSPPILAHQVHMCVSSYERCTYVRIRASFGGRQVPFLSACQSWFALSPLWGAADASSFGGSLMPCGYFQARLQNIHFRTTAMNRNAKIGGIENLQENAGNRSVLNKFQIVPDHLLSKAKWFPSYQHVNVDQSSSQNCVLALKSPRIRER